MASSENWLPVVGYENNYLVSNQGAVWSIKRQIELRPQLVKNGYYAVGLWKNNHRRTVPIHVIVAKAFIPNDNLDLIVLHGRLGIHINMPGNLRWGTHKDNSHDSVVRDKTNYEANRMACDHGHSFAEGNIRNGTGSNKCLACVRANSRVQNHRRLFEVNYTLVEFQEISDIYFNAIMAGTEASFKGTKYYRGRTSKHLGETK